MKLTKLFLFLASISALVISSDGSASAAAKTANLGVSVKVANNCIITAIDVGFPDYDPISTHASNPDNSTAGSVTITCNKGGAATLALDYGLNHSASQPRMKNGTDYLPYMLYSDPLWQTQWSGVARDVSGGTSQSAQVYTVYGQIPAAQPAVSGTYSDTVIATVNF
jgi:spore coat protein U-like protein